MPVLTGALTGTSIGFFLTIIGLVGAVWMGTAAASLLYQLEGHDPVVLTASAVTLAIVALGAGYIPANRASRVEPMQALRYE